jgi:hypothetical protein
MFLQTRVLQELWLLSWVEGDTHVVFPDPEGPITAFILPGGK